MRNIIFMLAMLLAGPAGAQVLGLSLSVGYAAKKNADLVLQSPFYQLDTRSLVLPKAGFYTKVLKPLTLELNMGLNGCRTISTYHSSEGWFNWLPNTGNVSTASGLQLYMVPEVQAKMPLLAQGRFTLGAGAGLWTMHRAGWGRSYSMFYDRVNGYNVTTQTIYPSFFVLAPKATLYGVFQGRKKPQNSIELDVDLHPSGIVTEIYSVIYTSASSFYSASAHTSMTAGFISFSLRKNFNLVKKQE